MAQAEQRERTEGISRSSLIIAEDRVRRERATAAVGRLTNSSPPGQQLADQREQEEGVSPPDQQLSA